MDWFLCPSWGWDISQHCLMFNGKGWGNSELCKIMDNNHGYGMRIHCFPQPITFRERKRLIGIFQLPNLSDKEWRREWWLQLLKELQLLSL